MNMVGPRRSGILFSSNAVFSVVLGWMFLGEKLGAMTLAGIALALGGVALAILFGKRRNDAHKWEAINGPLWAGVGIGLFAGLCQAVGSIIAFLVVGLFLLLLVKKVTAKDPIKF